MNHDIHLAQNERHILALTCKNHLRLDIQIADEVLHFGLIVFYFGGVGADHQESNIASSVPKHPRRLQITIDSLTRNQPSDAGTNRSAIRDTELAAHPARSSLQARRHNDAIAD